MDENDANDSQQDTTRGTQEKSHDGVPSVKKGFWARVVSTVRQYWPTIAWGWAAFTVVLVLIGFFKDVGGFYTWLKDGIPPDVQVTYYEMRDGHPEIVSPDGSVVEIGPKEIISERVPVPLNLAVRNRESEPLDVVRVEIGYDPALKVDSDAQPKIDPNNRRLVYEHDIGTLENQDYFTPLKTVDTVYVPFSFMTVSTLALTRDGTPIYITSVMGYDEHALVSKGEVLADKKVDFDIAVYSKDRPPVSGTISLTLKSNIEVLLNQLSNPEIVSVQEQDSAFFHRLPTGEGVETLDHWQGRQSEGGYLVDYSKIRYRDGVYQFIRIDGEVRRVIADRNSDGWIDYELWDTTRDGFPDIKSVAREKVSHPMTDWRREALL